MKFEFIDDSGSDLDASVTGTLITLSVSRPSWGEDTTSTVSMPKDKAREFAEWLLEQCK